MMGKKPLPHVQKLDADATEYFESYGIHSYDNQTDAGRGGVSGSAKVCKKLLDAAKAELKGTPEPIFKRVVLLTEAAEVPRSEEDDNKLAEALLELRTDIAQHTGLLSRETMAVSLLVGFALLKFEFRHPGRPTAMRTACFFADAWHYWHMEVFGEHEKAYVAKVRDEGIAQATATATMRRHRRLYVVSTVVKDILDTESNAECARRLKTVNAALKENDLSLYKTERALAKAVGRLRKLRA
jgi:hypothetical protein